jgi:cytidylate kinase
MEEKKRGECDRQREILAYAEDLVSVAKSEREMKEMMKSLVKYVRKKKLEMNGVQQEKEEE